MNAHDSGPGIVGRLSVGCNHSLVSNWDRLTDDLLRVTGAGIPNGTESTIDVSTYLEIMLPNMRHSSEDFRIEISTLLKVGLERSKVRVLQSPYCDGY